MSVHTCMDKYYIVFHIVRIYAYGSTKLTLKPFEYTSFLWIILFYYIKPKYLIFLSLSFISFRFLHFTHKFHFGILRLDRIKNNEVCWEQIFLFFVFLFFFFHFRFHFPMYFVFVVCRCGLFAIWSSQTTKYYLFSEIIGFFLFACLHIIYSVCIMVVRLCLLLIYLNMRKCSKMKNDWENNA